MTVWKMINKETSDCYIPLLLSLPRVSLLRILALMWFLQFVWMFHLTPKPYSFLIFWNSLNFTHLYDQDPRPRCLVYFMPEILESRSLSLLFSCSSNCFLLPSQSFHCKLVANSLFDASIFSWTSSILLVSFCSLKSGLCS